MPITQTADRENDVTIFTASGRVTYSEQMSVLKSFYAAKPTANVIWDLRDLSGPRLSSAELKKIVSSIKERGHTRKRGKTALVSTADLDFGLSRMVETYAENKNLAWQIQSFRTMKTARHWIRE
jgi:hypothetical protein